MVSAHGENLGLPPENAHSALPEWTYYTAMTAPEDTYRQLLAKQGVDLGAIDFSDPELNSRLDLPLSAVLDYSDSQPSEVQRIRLALTDTPITVRDALMLGKINVQDIRKIGSSRVERLKACLARCVPEFPLMDEYAAASVATLLYEDPHDVPVAAPIRSGRVTVGDCMDSAAGSWRDYYRHRVRAVVKAYNEAEILSQPGGTEIRKSYSDQINDVDFDDPDLQYRLDQHLSVVVANARGGHDDTTDWRIHAALIGVNVTVRDAITLGLAQAGDLRGMGVKRMERLRESLERYMPEIPVMDEPAPEVAVTKLYRDPMDVPLLMPAGNTRLTVGEYLMRGTEWYRGDRVQEIMQAFEPPPDDSVDPTIVAIAAVAVTLDDDPRVR